MSVLLDRPPGADRRVTYELRKARVDYRCDDYPASFANVIRAGETYLVCTEFPGGESGSADAAGKPVRLRICLHCAPRWVIYQAAERGLLKSDDLERVEPITVSDLATIIEGFRKPDSSAG